MRKVVENFILKSVGGRKEDDFDNGFERICG